MSRNGELIGRLGVGLQDLQNRVPVTFDQIMDVLSLLLEEPEIFPQQSGHGDIVALIRRLHLITQHGVPEIILVPGVANFIAMELRRGADVEGGYQKRAQVRAEIEYFLAHPDVYRQKAARADPPHRYAQAADAEIVEHLNVLLSSLDRLDQPNVEAVAGAWAAQTAWSEIIEQHLPDAVFEEWNWADGLAGQEGGNGR